MKKLEHVLSLSYGKDSIAALGAIEELGWPLDRIVHAEVWATDTIPADLPPMVEFKAKADKIIKERWGIEVEHVTSSKTFEDIFYRVYQRSRDPEKNGRCYGWPTLRGNWCTGELKNEAVTKAKGEGNGKIRYLGIAADEPNRFHNLTPVSKSPLVELGWTEADCWRWCEANDLLSPIYTTSARGGCWFCHNQGIPQLRHLRATYPDLWAMMLKWDADSPVSFHPDGRTVRDFERRFAAEDAGVIPTDRRFRWDMLDQTYLGGV